MKESDKTFAGSVPDLYDRYLGPLIFEPYALDMAERVAAIGAQRILEAAAGTGIVSRAMAQRMPKSSILATDLNQPMIDQAVKHGGFGNVTYGQADAQVLPFEDQSFDAVVCQFGVMFFPDKPKAFAAARRVLKPGGRYLFNVWDRIEENDLANLAVATASQLYPKNPPNFLARTPHGHHDKGLLERLLREAGFSKIEIDTVAKTAKAPSASHPAVGYCQGTPMRGEIEAQGAGELERATAAVEAAIAKRFGTGPSSTRIQAIVFSASR